MRVLMASLFLIVGLAELHAQEVEEIVVTGSQVSPPIPGTHLRRSADNLLLRVQIVNDSREEEQREEEIHKTLLAAITAADRNQQIELSTVSERGFVLPLTKANYQVELGSGQRPDTSVAFFRAKSAVPDSLDDGEALVLALKRFVSGLKMVGRTEVFVDGDVELSIVDPSQYRAEVIRLLADDVRTVTGALGADYRVIVNGIDGPVRWSRAGSISVAIYIPYEYMVVPTTISGISAAPDY